MSEDYICGTCGAPLNENGECLCCSGPLLGVVRDEFEQTTQDIIDREAMLRDFECEMYKRLDAEDEKEG